MRGVEEPIGHIKVIDSIRISLWSCLGTYTVSFPLRQVP